MKSAAILAPVLALLVVGCNDVVDRQTDRASNAIAADVDRASDNIVGSVGDLTNTIDSHADRVADRALADAANEADRAGDQLARDVRTHADAAADRAGEALQGLGKSLRDRDAER